MDKKKIVGVGTVCLLFLFLAGYVEMTEHSLNSKNQIIRGSPGSGSAEVELTLNAGDVLQGYDYDVTIPAMGITGEEAQDYFLQAEKEIEKSFFFGRRKGGACHSFRSYEVILCG